MKTEAQSHNRDRNATTARFGLAAFVVAELLCTGALVVWGFLSVGHRHGPAVKLLEGPSDTRAFLFGQIWSDLRPRSGTVRSGQPLGDVIPVPCLFELVRVDV